MALFPTFFFLSNIGQENIFYEIQNEKTPFYAIKTKRSVSRKIGIFSKGLTHGVLSTNGRFSNFYFLGNIGQENVF